MHENDAEIVCQGKGRCQAWAVSGGSQKAIATGTIRHPTQLYPLRRIAMSKKLNLKEHISSKEKKQGYVNQMFATIAPRYDFITIFLSLGMDQGWKRKLIEMLDL
jgi:hypothetical protein